MSHGNPKSRSAPRAEGMSSDAERDEGMCAMCPTPRANMRCLCTFPLLPLCSRCVQMHLAERDGVHIPVETCSVVLALTKDQVAAANVKKRNVHSFKSRLDSVFREISAAFREIETNYQIEKQKLKLAKEQRLNRLKELQDALENELKSAIEEASRSLLRKEGNIHNPLTRNILSHGDLALQDYLSSYSSLNLPGFASLKTQNSLPETAETEIRPVLRREEISELRVIPLVNSTELRFYDVSSGRYSDLIKLSQGLEVSGYPGVVWANEELICCGGGYYQAPSPHTYGLSIEGQVRSLSDMILSRASHGLISVNGHIYSFGGVHNKVLSACERLELRTGKKNRPWEELMDMTEPRRCFTPCVYQANVYICGGWTSHTIETFSLLTMNFVSLGVKLMEAGETLTGVVGEELVVVSQHSCFRLNLSDYTCTKTTHFTWTGISSSSPSLPHGQSLYTSNQGQIVSVDLTTRQVDRLSVL